MFLGSMITKDGNSQNEIATRLSRARQTFGRLGHIWNSRKIPQIQRTRCPPVKDEVVSIGSVKCYRVAQ